MKKIALFVISCTLLSLPFFVHAHVGYVVGDEEFVLHEGHDFPYLMSPLHEGHNKLIFVLGAIGLIFLYWLSHKNYFISEKVAAVTTRLRSYHEFIPWILRLSIGIALIGAGAGGVFISPLTDATNIVPFLELVAGFMILLGFLLVPITVLALVLYTIALIQNSYMLGNLDFAVIALGIIILGSSRPGLDDILGLPKLAIEKLKQYVPFILRVGVGAAMIFLALYEKIFNPHVSALVVENFNLMHVINVSPEMWVLSAGLVELIVGFLLMIGFHTRLTAVIAFVVITLSFFYFGEDVYSHVTLFGVLSAIFIYGGGKGSLDRLWYKHS